MADGGHGPGHDHNYGIVPHLPHGNDYQDEPLMAPVYHVMAGDAVNGPKSLVPLEI
jgi:hypothetical protein